MALKSDFDLNQYKRNRYEFLTLQFFKDGTRSRIAEAAARNGQSMNRFIIDTVLNRIEREKAEL